MPTITPHLWYDHEAKEAAEFYASIFPGSKVTNVITLPDTPSGDAASVSFELAGQPFMAISGGPLFKFNPSVSFQAMFKTKAEVEAAWKRLVEGGAVLMELGPYPFSELYGWLQDRYGLSWQLAFAGDRDIKQVITPVLTFTGKVAGQAEEAMKFYTSLFEPSQMQVMARYEAGEEPNQPGMVKYANFNLAGNEFGAMDSAQDHQFAFNEAISFMINCDTQAQIDDYWAKLSAVPEAEQCGWLKDKFGLSWQVTPTAMADMMSRGAPEQISRVVKAFLPMKKFNLAELQKAYDGK